MDLTYGLTWMFDFVLSSSVMTALIELVIFGKLILICSRAWSLEIWLISFQVWDDLIGSNKVDLYEMLLKECFGGKLQGYQYRFARASVLLVFLLALGSKSSSLSARVSFVSPGCTIRLVLCCFFLHSLFTLAC